MRRPNPKNFAAITVTALIVLMTGCASAPKDPPHEPPRSLKEAALSFKPPSGKAGIYIISPHRFLDRISSGDGWDASLDNQKPATIPMNSFVYTPVWPGEHNVRGLNDTVPLFFMAKEGQNYFFTVGPSMSGKYIKPITAEGGKKYVQQCNMSGKNFYQLPFMPGSVDSNTPAACHIVIAQKDLFVFADTTSPGNLNFEAPSGNGSAGATGETAGAAFVAYFFMVFISAEIDGQVDKHHIAKADKLSLVLQGHGFNDSFGTNFQSSFASAIKQSPWIHAMSVDIAHQERNATLPEINQHPVVQIDLVYFLSSDASSLIMQAHLRYFSRGETNATYSRFYTYFSEPLSVRNKKAIAQWSASNDELLRKRMQEGISQLITMMDIDFFHRKPMDPDKRSVIVSCYNAFVDPDNYRGFVLANEGQRIIVQKKSGNIFSTIGRIVDPKKELFFIYDLSN